MERVYSGREYIEGIRESEEWNGKGRRIREGKVWGRNTKNKTKEKEIKLNPETEKFKRGELPERYTAKLLYGWDNKKFDEEYLKKLEKNWNR